MPRVAPATWTKRSRRVAGSCHVRLRQVTGIPRPSPGRTAAARRSRTRARRPPRADDRRARVVGEQPLPARHVAREPVDELRRRRDVDADRRAHAQRPAAPRAQATRSTTGSVVEVGRTGSTRRGRSSRRARRGASPPVDRRAVDDARGCGSGGRWSSPRARAPRSGSQQRRRCAPSSPVSSRDLAQDAVGRVLAELEPAARERPHAGLGVVRARCRHEEDGVRRPRTTRRPRSGSAGSRRRAPTQRAGGTAVTARGARRGTAGRGRGTRARGRPSRGPSSHGCHRVRASRRAACSNSAGPGEERLDEQRHEVLRSRTARRIARS